MVEQPTAHRLLATMKEERKRVAGGDEVDFAEKYAAEIKAVGHVAFLTTLFQEMADAELTGWLVRLAPIWKDLPFADWREVLRRVASAQPAVYQFVWFAGAILAIDVGKMIRSDPEIGTTTRRSYEFSFPNGSPRPSEWEKERLEERGVDWANMWRRLEFEGAPMNLESP